MFSGIVQDVGTVISVKKKSESSRIVLQTLLPLSKLKIGDSVSCNGICLTVVGSHKLDDKLNCFEVDVGPETLKKTSAGFWGEGTELNLEAAMIYGGEVSGHLVSGHVDGLGKIKNRQERPDGFVYLEIEASDLHPYFIPQGSVALCGTSLTIADVTANGFKVMLIPQTLSATILGTLKVEALVEVECDHIVKTVVHTLRNMKSFQKL